MKQHPKTRRAPSGGIVELRIALAGIEPAIWRRVLVPASFSLHDLHRVIQEVFGWLDYHLYSFTIGDESFEAPDEEAAGRDSTKTPLSKLGPNGGDASRTPTPSATTGCMR